MKRRSHEVWVEIASLACSLSGLFFFTIAGLQLVPLVAHWLLTGKDVMVVQDGLAVGWREQAIAVIALALPGVGLFAGAWALRFFLSEERRSAESLLKKGI